MPRRNRNSYGRKRRIASMIGETQLRLRVHCDCGKVAAESEVEARELFMHVAEYNRNHHPVRFYQCDYGHWHWTRMYVTEESEDE